MKNRKSRQNAQRRLNQATGRERSLTEEQIQERQKQAMQQHQAASQGKVEQLAASAYLKLATTMDNDGEFMFDANEAFSEAMRITNVFSQAVYKLAINAEYEQPKAKKKPVKTLDDYDREKTAKKEIPPVVEKDNSEHFQPPLVEEA